MTEKEKVEVLDDEEIVLELEPDEDQDKDAKDKEFGDKAKKFDKSDEDITAEEDAEDSEEPRKMGRAEKRIRGLLAKNKQLQEQYDNDLRVASQYIQSVEQELQTSRKRTQTSESAYVEEAEDRLKAQLERARKDFIMAKQNDDEEAMLSAQEQLAEVKVEQRNLANLKVKLKADEVEEAAEAEKDKKKAPTQTKQEKPKLSAKAASWAKRNKEWFIPAGAEATFENKKRTSLAVLVHERLLEEGFDPRDNDDEDFGEDAYYEELNTRIKRELNIEDDEDDSEEEEPRRTKQLVAGGSHTPGSSSKKKNVVKLSKTEQETARRLGIDPKRYAEEKNKIAKRGGA